MKTVCIKGYTLKDDNEADALTISYLIKGKKDQTRQLNYLV
ncbi:hypothetical protein HNQ74_000686 [Bartonella doshiae]|uniref:Uncharacterized protein n=2 Tax=Bartonella doshiae TaxID=33044 RepID=A0A380ZEW9_BARDO|nr:hypothetical protein MCS_00736 [Bartonella doshiae NCTC 12862 = ATCC 700133]MBB6159268.1 hypothetical protein [Bartonella doshiae]SUV45171.1 Uncharacterised protein [Bartonella doshiae]